MNRKLPHFVRSMFVVAPTTARTANIPAVTRKVAKIDFVVKTAKISESVTPFNAA